MSLENEDGMQWFKAGWRRGARKFTPADAAERNYRRTLEDLSEIRRKAVQPHYLWNSPCTPPDKPGVYLVAAWAEYDPAEDGTIALVRCAHWNGLRWSKTFPVRKGASEMPERRFNPRQDYPWREVCNG